MPGLRVSSSAARRVSADSVASMRSTVSRRSHACSDQPGRHRRDGPDDEGGQEDLAAKADRHGTGSVSLYPNCFTVVSASAISGSFSRSRRTWTSTVRVPPV